MSPMSPVVDVFYLFGMKDLFLGTNRSASCMVDAFYRFGMKEFFLGTILNVRGSPLMVGEIDSIRWPKRETREGFICTWFKILQSIQ